MSNSELLLVLISGLGVLHGIFCVVFLLSSSTEKGFSADKILALLITVLSLRVGKSVWLYFSANISINLIFTGLTLLLAIGPLYLMYVYKLASGKVLKPVQALHFVPLMVFLTLGIMSSETFLRELPIQLLGSFFLFFYGHFMVYVIIGLVFIRSDKWGYPNPLKKEWLTRIGYALLCIWLVYILNLFEEEIPYVIGPIMYSLVMYAATFITIKKSYLSKITHQKYKSTPISETEMDSLYAAILQYITKQEVFKEADLSLDLLSEAIHTTPQKTSLVINQRTGKNFNQFINSFRVTYAQQLLKNPSYENFTIASIGLEAGFNSVNSFNQAFKKETGTTPSQFRKS